MSGLVGMAELYGWSPLTARLTSGSQLRLEGFDENVFGERSTLSNSREDIDENGSHAKSKDSST